MLIQAMVEYGAAASGAASQAPRAAPPATTGTGAGSTEPAPGAALIRDRIEAAAGSINLVYLALAVVLLLAFRQAVRALSR